MKIAVLTGAGVSAESGLKTFRDAGGLWEGYRVEDVATPEAWRKSPELVLRFYNERRSAMYQAAPNAAHLALAELERAHAVTVITQNVDNLHERAGSGNVLHLHGELDYARSTLDPKLIYHLSGRKIELGDRCERGSQLRPHIVWFGESVPLIEMAAEIVAESDYLLVVGTSLAVYPAAGLVDVARAGTPVTVVDPGELTLRKGVRHLRERAGEGVPKVVAELIGSGTRRPGCADSKT